jgi:sugar/nucleoside kinase (ribokinase family)
VFAIRYNSGMHIIPKLEAIDYLVIGHITLDLTPEGPKMGGTASYAALTAKAFGLKVGVVTSWGEEIALGPMAEVLISNQLAKRSTTFENIYTADGRHQIIHYVANPLTLQSIPMSWMQTPIIHLGPIANEVAPEIAMHFPEGLLGVTPQGWFRIWDDAGRVYPTEWQDAGYILSHADATIISTEDVASNEDVIEELATMSPILVVTEGFYGARIYWHGDVRRFNAPEVEEVDATGAGDIFATAFFIQYHKTRNPWESTRFANRIASHSVTRSGLGSVPTQEEIRLALSEVLL